MRGRNAIGVALRAPDGSIVSAAEPLNSILHRNRFARAPFFPATVLALPLGDAGLAFTGFASR